MYWTLITSIKFSCDQYLLDLVRIWTCDLTSVEQAFYHCSTLDLEMLSVTIRTQAKHFISA